MGIGACAPAADAPPAGTPAGDAADSPTLTNAEHPSAGGDGDGAHRGDGDGADRGDGDGSADRDDAVRRWREKSERRRKPHKKRPWWIEIPVLLVTAFILTFLIQTFLFKVYYVPSGSMETTLHGVQSGGDRILVNKVIYDFRGPKPGDIVVFKGPPTWAAEANIPGPTSWLGKLGQAVGSVVGVEPPNEMDFVKRVIAVGGQTVKCCDANGNVQVDGVSLTEPYIYTPSPAWDFTPGEQDCSSQPKAQRCFGPVKIPPGQLWMMGDHRDDSADSSYGCQGGGAVSRCQGPVPVSDVIGKAIFIIMPISRWHTLGDPRIDHRAG